MSEDFLRPALDQCPASLVVTDREGHIRYVNRSFERCTGYAAEDCLGKNPRVLKSGHHPKPFYTALWNTILGGGVWSGELLNKRRNGERYWESALIGPVYEQGAITHFVAVKQEVGPLKQAAARLNWLLESISEGFLEVDAEGVVTAANSGAARRLGYERPDELLGQSPVVELGEGQVHLRGRDQSVQAHPARLGPPGAPRRILLTSPSP